VAAVHRIFIAGGFLCALLYALFEARAWSRSGAPAAAARAALALAAAGAIAVYFRSLRGLNAKLAPPDTDDAERPRRS
jgi:hypothetical protein